MIINKIMGIRRIMGLGTSAEYVEPNRVVNAEGDLGNPEVDLDFEGLSTGTKKGVVTRESEDSRKVKEAIESIF